MMFALLFFTLSFSVFQCAAGQAKNFPVSVRTLVGNVPEITTVSTYHNFQTKFLSGCEYTITAWVWLWKRKQPTRTESIIFTSREALPIVESNSSFRILPSILFNGYLPDRYFFSITRDIDTNSYINGLWSENHLRYFEWTHLTMSIYSNSFTAYVNGVWQGSSKFHGSPQEICNKTIAGADFNNTILQLAGGVNVWGTSGMFQDVLLFQNVALAEENVKELYEKTKPSESKSLRKIMKEYKIYTLSDFTPIIRKGSFYGEIEWGFCPSTVCGNICISEAFYVANDLYEGYWSADKHQDISIELIDIDDLRTKFELLLSDMSDVDNENSDTESTASSDETGADHQDGKLTVKEEELLSRLKKKIDSAASRKTGLKGLLNGASRALQKILDGGDFTGDHDIYEEDMYLDSEDLADFYGGNLDDLYDNLGYGADFGEEYVSSFAYSDEFYDDLSPEEVGLLDDLIERRTKKSSTSKDFGKLHEQGNGYEPKVRKTDDSLIHNSAKIGISDDSSSAKADAAESGNDDEIITEDTPTSTAISSDSDESYDKGIKLDESNFQPTKKKSIFPQKPKWNSRFLGKKKNVILDAADEKSSKSSSSFIKSVTTKIQELTGISVFGVLLNDSYSNESQNSTRNNTNSSKSKIKKNMILSTEDLDFREVYRQMYPELDENLLRVQELYESALLWICGRHNDFVLEANMDISEWKQRMYEQSNAALTLAMWLADDLYTDTDHDVSWPFYYPNSISHPLLLALGFRAGYERKELSFLIEAIKFVGRDYANKTVTNLNTGYISSMLGVEYSSTLVDISLRSALGNTDLLSLMSEGDQNGKSAHKHVDMTGSEEIDKTKIETTVGLDGQSQYHTGVDQSIKSVFDSTSSFDAISVSESPDTTCELAASYYFPIAQYVAPHFGIIDSGVGKPEDIRLADGLAPLELYQGGEGATMHEFKEAEAQAGNPSALMWLAMRYFWGYGGVEPNMPMARRLIEMAAEANHPEGLYNLGVLHENGLAGLPVNRDLALDYFQRAADHPRPFDMAVHAMGSNHLRGFNGMPKNITKALQYYAKAARMHSADAYFSLAGMMRSNSYNFEPNIPVSVFFYAKAAEKGHVRSLSSLSQALWDPSSWLGEYVRKKRSGIPLLLKEKSRVKEIENITDFLNTTLSLLGYNESEPITINIPGSTDILLLPWPLDVSCQAALPLLKFLSEHSYRVRDSARGGLDSFMAGDTWAALDYYDEAADLGSASAQENSAFIYELLSKSECESLVNTNDAQDFHFLKNSVVFVEDFVLQKFGFNISLSTLFSQENKPLENLNNSLKYLPNLEGINCTVYYSKMAAHRRVQMVANKDPYAMRRIADNLLVGTFPFPRNATAAAILYGNAAELGDVNSLMSLGWMFYSGYDGRLLFSTLFAAAIRWEVLGKLDRFSISAESTGGLAPTLAWIYVNAEHIYSSGDYFNLLGKIFGFLNNDSIILILIVPLFFTLLFAYCFRRRPGVIR